MGLLSLGFVLCSAVASPAPEARRAVVLTTDCGAEIDDQWALTHLALCPEFDLKGVVTTHAPSLRAETSARTARDILSGLLRSTNVPVLAGSSEPLRDRSHPRRNPGVEFLLEQARGHTAEDPLVVLIIGAATDVASALLADPTWADRVSFVAMAFEGWPAGTDPWNVKNDIAAWQVVMASRAPLAVGDAAVTRRRLLMTRARARALLGGHGPAAEKLVALVQDWLDRHPDLAQDQAGRRDAWPIWDEVVTAHLLGLTTTKMFPRPRLRDDMTFDHAQDHGTITWITDIDEARLWADLVAKLDRGRREPRSP